MIARAPRLGRRFRIAHLGVVGHVGGRRVDRFGGAVGQLFGRRFGLRAHALAVGRIGRVAVLTLLVLAGILLAVLAFLLVGFARPVLAHVETIEQVVDDIAEAALIVDHPLEPVEILAGAILDQRPPQIDELLRRHRRCLAGEPLAHQHGERILDRRIGAVGDLVKFAAMEAIVEHGGEILLHAAHAAGADRLDAGLFDGLEHGACLLSAGCKLAVHARIVTGEFERNGVGMAAHDRGFALVKPARWLGQARLAAG